MVKKPSSCCSAVDEQFLIDFVRLTESPDAVALEAFLAPDVIEVGSGDFTPEVHIGRAAVIANIIAFSQFATNQHNDFVSISRTECATELLSGSDCEGGKIGRFTAEVQANFTFDFPPGFPEGPTFNGRHNLIMRFNKDCKIDRLFVRTGVVNVAPFELCPPQHG